jgi:hypothetical protein
MGLNARARLGEGCAVTKETPAIQAAVEQDVTEHPCPITSTLTPVMKSGSTGKRLMDAAIYEPPAQQISFIPVPTSAIHLRRLCRSPFNGFKAASKSSGLLATR